ncbi:MAG: guanylate kinase [Flavobacteriales bacterium]|jgi:guanylate kinase
MKQGKAIIFSAPSGAGKTTIVKHLLNVRDDLAFSISACSRPRRTIMEEDGVDYYFFSVETFKEKVVADEFVEWEEVYKDSFYGTLKSEVERVWSMGKVVIFDVDVVGGKNLKEYFGDAALAVFVKPPSIESLRTRLEGRKTESKEVIDIRVEKAESELKFEPYFDVAIKNDVLQDALIEAEQVIDNFIKEDESV